MKKLGWMKVLHGRKGILFYSLLKIALGPLKGYLSHEKTRGYVNQLNYHWLLEIVCLIKVGT